MVIYYEGQKCKVLKELNKSFKVKYREKIKFISKRKVSFEEQGSFDLSVLKDLSRIELVRIQKYIKPLLTIELSAGAIFRAFVEDKTVYFAALSGGKNVKAWKVGDSANQYWNINWEEIIDVTSDSVKVYKEGRQQIHRIESSEAEKWLFSKYAEHNDKETRATMGGYRKNKKK
jgi:hypothetical protein